MKYSIFNFKKSTCVVNMLLNTLANTVFRRIYAPGVEAENEPLPLHDLHETRRVDYRMPILLSDKNMILITPVFSEI